MAATVRASQTGLEKIDQARRSKGWVKTQEAWYQLATTSEATLKRFWAGHPIRQEIFADICKVVGIEDWQTIADFSIPSHQTLSTLPPPGIYGAATWVERIEPTETLLPILQSDRRVIVLTGMTGIGKTALAERLTLPLQDGKTLRRLNLDDGGVTPDFATSGAALLRSLGEEPTLEDQKDERNLLNHILDRLRTRLFRIQIDSMERLLEGDDLRQGWSEFCDALWLDLLQQVLAGGDCQSQMILTTQDVPGELEAIGSRYPQRWHCELIRGLSEAEQLQLFQQHSIVAALDASVEAQHPNATTHNANATGQPLNVTSHNANAGARNANAEGQHRIAGAHNATEPNSAVSLLRRIGKLYEGHPLVLRVIAEDIKTCGGNIQRYWQQCRFEELEANRPAKFSRRALQVQVNQRVRESIQRLPNDAQQLLYRSAVYRRPVPESFWLALLPERNAAQQQAALNLLKARTFAEEDWEPGVWLGADGEIPLRQHNLIRSVAYEMLKADSTWETAERQAADQWLTAYQPAPDAPNLEKVRGCLEAFDHYYEIRNWDKASEVLLTRRDTAGEELHWQLHTWSYFREQIQLCSKILEKVSPRLRIEYLRGLTLAHDGLYDYQKMVEYAQQQFKIAQEIGELQEQGNALGNLGLALYREGEFSQARDLFQQALNIAKETGDIPRERNALGNLGLVYLVEEDFEKALNYFQRHLEISRDLHDSYEETTSLCNLGRTHGALCNYQQAIDCYQKSLEVAQKTGDLQGQGNALVNLGNIFNKLNNIQEAIKCYQKTLKISREIGDQYWEGGCLIRLGIVYNNLGKYQRAIGFFEQCLIIAREIENQEIRGAALGNLGIALNKLERYPEAIELLQVALEIFQDIGLRVGEAEVLKALTELHQKTGEIDRALEYCDRALGLAIELGIPLAEKCRSLQVQLENER